MNNLLPAPLRGIIPPLVTPLLHAERLDLPGLERLVENLIAGGCNGIFVLGTTGEAPALSHQTRLEMLRQTCRLVQGRVPLLVGISDTSIAESIEFGRKAAELGAAAVVTTPPYYFRMGQEDLLLHAEMLVEALDLPLFLYNIPSLTKLHYRPETVRAAANIEGVAGFKDSSGDLIYLQRVLRLTSEVPSFSVLTGPEELLPQAISLGAHGGITGGANLFPNLYVALFKAASSDSIEQVSKLQTIVMEISEKVYRIGDPSTSYLRGLKCALELREICSGLPAPPLAPFTDGERRQLSQYLQELNLDSARL